MHLQQDDAYICLDASQVRNLDDNYINHLTFPFSIPGESPPPPPRACFGRDDLIEKIVGLAENLTPTALIGAGGIGKTSIVLAVLHNARIKQRFGDNRRFIRCDQFPTSLTNFLSRLSKVIGADIENPEDLTPLRPFLSSREMLLVLDNAESILDPQGTAAQEIYAVVEELSHLETMCLCITSRISTIPSDCETLDIPTLSMEAARDVFYRTYRNGKRSDQVNNILERLDFHPLSITLLATVAHHNKWDPGRLTREWERRRTGVLCTHHNQSLAATIELSLASPMFQKLGASTRDLLGVVAFFPQGIDENNFDWLFPTIPDQSSIFDSFCVLSLTYRSNGFITMLAPLRDYLRLKDPNSSPLLCMAKDCYFSRLLVDVDPDSPSFEEAQWITSEDVNVEHLLDIFTSINANSTSAWEACAHFMGHLYWYKPRRVVLGPKIKGLPDGHPSKPQCFLMLSQIFSSFGNRVESKQLLIQTLELWNKQGDDLGVAQTLRFLSYVNRLLGLHKEGVQQAKEALEIYEKLGDAVGQAQCLNSLAWLLFGDNQLNAAEEAASQAITLSLNQGKQYQVCQCHRILGRIYHSKGMRGKAMDHLEAALKTASSFNWHSQQFWILYFLAQLFSDEGRFDDAHAHIERAKFHATNDTYNLARAMGLQARFWYKQCRFEEATSVALDAADMFEKLGAMKDVEDCRRLIQDIEGEIVLVAF